MNDQRISYVVTPRPLISAAAWLPASYRARAVQQDERSNSSRSRAQAHFAAASKKIARIKRSRSNPALAAALAFVLGPIGMLYATPVGAVVIAVLDFAALLFLHPPQLIMAWTAGIVWSVIAVIVQNNGRNADFEEAT